MVTNDQATELQKLAHAAAKRVGSSWPDAVEVGDLAQEIVLRLLESPGALEKVFVEDEPTRKAFLIKVGHQVASEMFQDYERYSGNYTYDVARVRGLLDNDALAWKPEDFSPEIADLREAMDNLKESSSRYYAEIVNRWTHGIIPDRSDTAAYHRIGRAVEALTAQMNHIGADRKKNYTEGPGTRTVMSNASSVHLLSTQDV